MAQQLQYQQYLQQQGINIYLALSDNNKSKTFLAEQQQLNQQQQQINQQQQISQQQQQLSQQQQQQSSQQQVTLKIKFVCMF